MPLPNRPSLDISSVCPRSMPDGLSSEPWTRVRAWRIRYVPVRAALVAFLAFALGLWGTRGVLPTVSADEIGLYIHGHALGEGSILALWMRLCAAQLPLYVLLFCAGLTRFSGALTSGVLLTCGMADGAALALLWYAATQGLAPVALPVACLLRVAIELALRVCMATAACRLARRMDDRDCEGAGDYPSFRLLARYIAAFVLVIGAVAVVCLGYVVLIF